MSKQKQSTVVERMPDKEFKGLDAESAGGTFTPEALEQARERFGLPVVVMAQSQSTAYNRQLATVRRKDFTFDEDWDEVALLDGESYYRKGLYKRKMKGGVFTADFHYVEEVPDTENIDKLNDVLKKLRDEGFNKLAFVLEYQTDWEGDTYSIADSLVKTVKRVKKIRIENPIFIGSRFNEEVFNRLENK